jgi:glycosyltransferase 2 family protein
MRVAGSALILALLFHYLPLRQTWGTLARLPASLWVLVLLGYLAVHVVGVAKWRVTVNLAGSGLSFSQAARCYFAGLFATLFLPSLIGGDIVRAGLALRLGRSKAAVLFGSLTDRFLDFLALVIIATYGGALVPGTLNAASQRVRQLLGIISVGLTLLAAVAFFLLPARRFSYRTRRHLVRLREAGRSMMSAPQYALLSLGLGVLIQSSFILLNIVLAEACGVHVVTRVWLFAWPLAKLAAVLPITYSGIGVREAALVWLLQPFGASPTLTLSAGLAWEGVMISGGLVGGAAAALLGRARQPVPNLP